MDKRFYVTQKQVEKYIQDRNSVFNDLFEFKKELEYAISEFNKTPDYNKAQLKFFNRVLIRVCQLIILDEINKL